MSPIAQLMAAIKAAIKGSRSATVIEPILDLLSRERVWTLILSLLAFILIPSIPNITPEWAERIGNAIFYGGGLLLLGLTVQAIQETNVTLPKGLKEILSALFAEVLANQQTTKPTTTTVKKAVAALPPAAG